MALISDNFQYRERFNEDEGDRAYVGPWQTSLRDIDPSCTMRSCPGGQAWRKHGDGWWDTVRYSNWRDPESAKDWAANPDDLPDPPSLLDLSDPRDNSRWLNLQAFFHWSRDPPANKRPSECDERELWCLCNGYLIPKDAADPFMEWARKSDFSGRWMPDPPEYHYTFLGEHDWSPSSHYFQAIRDKEEPFVRPSRNCPTDVQSVALDYYRESGGFDCSVDDGFCLRLPSSQLLKGLDLRWSGNRADYVDRTGQLTAYDPTAHASGPSALLVRRSAFLNYLNSANLTFCWVILGEKQFLPHRFPNGTIHELVFSGAYILGEAGAEGFLNHRYSTHSLE